MRVVVAMPPGPVGERFEAVLRARGYDVVRIVARLSADVVAKVAADIYICGDRRSLRLVRSAASERTPHLIAALPRLEEKLVVAALAAGAVDIMARSACAAELVARIELPGRLTVEGWSGRSGRLRAVGVWDAVPGMMSDCVASAFGWSMATAPHVGGPPEVSSAIRLTCREDASTVELLVGCSAVDGRSLVHSQLGEDGPASAITDCLGETANVLAGVFKQAVMGEGLGVTLGLPRDCNPKKFAKAEPAWVLKGNGLALVLGMVSGQGGLRTVHVAELTPGMVLCRDVLLHGGVPFVRAGTALTERTIEKLGEILGTGASVAVAEAPLKFAECDALDDDGILLFEAV
ncbi:MAG: hypothetical protein KUG77_05785 [Nannocystaceae bacterium]|nr:hypothetical protein [Nannocystaceae bacterium]